MRSQDNAEEVDEAGKRTVPETVTATEKSENVVQNNIKSKRAEMERYVPKAVANELAQQSSVQQSVPASINKTISDEIILGEQNLSRMSKVFNLVTQKP